MEKTYLLIKEVNNDILILAEGSEKELNDIISRVWDSGYSVKCVDYDKYIEARDDMSKLRALVMNS